MNILDRIQQIKDVATRDSLTKKYMDGGVGYKDFIGIDNELAMAMSLIVTKTLIAANVSAGNEVRAREIMAEHNAFCESLQ